MLALSSPSPYKSPEDKEKRQQALDFIVWAHCCSGLLKVTRPMHPLWMIHQRCLQISSGEEGWQVNGGVNSSWITNGTKGVDFAGNLELFDFATVHLCKPPALT